MIPKIGEIGRGLVVAEHATSVSRGGNQWGREGIVESSRNHGVFLSRFESHPDIERDDGSVLSSGHFSPALNGVG
jgi:hypothetical protein